MDKQGSGRTEPSLLPLRRLAFVLLYFTGSIAFYSKHEGWSFFECLFFIISTISTVGYGSPSPTDDKSRLFSIFFIFVGIGVIFSGISDLANHRLNKVQDYFCGTCFKASEKKDEETLHHKKTMVLAIFYILFINLLGAIAFKYIEDWSWITAFYFAVETSTSVGFGELPISEKTRVFLCFYIIISIVLIAYAINSFNAVLVAQNTLRERKLLLKQMQSLDFIADLNDGQGVRKHEFVLAVLSHLGVLNKERDVDPWMKKFEDFDADNSGILNREELSFFFEQETAESQEELKRIKERAKANVIKELLDDRISFVENMLPSFNGASRASIFQAAGSETLSEAVPSGVGAGYGPGRGSLFMGGMPSMSYFGSRRGTGGTIQSDKALAQSNKVDNTFSGWNTTPNPIIDSSVSGSLSPNSIRSGSTTAVVEPQENPMHRSNVSNNSNSSPKSSRTKKSPTTTNSKSSGPVKINKAGSTAKTRGVRAPSGDLEMGSVDASNSSGSEVGGNGDSAT